MIEKETLPELKQRLTEINTRLSDNIPESTYRELMKTKNELLADIQHLEIQQQQHKYQP
jgi:hypothetical protein